MPDRPDSPAAAPYPVDGEQLRLLLDGMTVGVYRAALDGDALWANPALRRMLDGAERLPPWPPEFRRRLEAEGLAADFLRRWPGTAAEWVSETAWLIRDARGEPVAVAGTVTDATARMRAEARAAHLARHDQLTGLANRLDFAERLDAALAAGQDRLAVLLLDLDRFKAVNDSLGHAAGDAVLQAIAARMASLAGPQGILARLGGDEFAIVQPGAGPAEAVALAERLLALARAPLAVDGREIAVGASLGIAIAPRDGADSAALLQAADMALYQAKAAGRDMARAFAPDMAEAILARRRLEADLRGALGRGEFSLVYQPIHDATDGAVAGHEALLRWTRPGRGVVAAETFIGLADDLGLLPEIGAWALERACLDAAAAPAAGAVWVNVSPVQLAAPGFEARLAAAVARPGLPPERLVLEITETALMTGQADLAPLIDRLRARGLRIALDDFGTGYSALGYLSRFAFDVIKIDKSFIQGLERPQTAAIVGCVLDLARRLGISTVGEGVETRDQLAALRAAGCRYVQGHVFGPPKPGLRG